MVKVKVVAATDRALAPLKFILRNAPPGKFLALTAKVLILVTKTIIHHDYYTLVSLILKITSIIAQ